MVLIVFFLTLLLIGFVTYLVQKFRADHRLNRKFHDFGDGNAIVYVIIALIAVFIGTNIFLNEPQFENYTEQESYGVETAQPWLVSETYRTRLESDSLNADYMFALIEAHYDPAQHLGPSVSAYNNEEAFIYQKLLDFTLREDSVQSDFGHLFLGIYCFQRAIHSEVVKAGDMEDAGEHLSQVKNTNLKYYNNILGRVNYYYGNHNLGKRNLWTEVKSGGYKKGAYENLALIYDYEKDYNSLAMLTYTEESKPFIPYRIRTGVYIRANDVVNYTLDLFGQFFQNVNLVGFSGALFILLVWMMYLMRVNVQRSTTWLSAILVVIFSSVLIFPVWLLYDYFGYGLNFALNGEIWNDFLFCVFGIGVIEEFVKIVPFLIILLFTKKIKEPIDYIIYASLCALGFAFVENFQYFQQDSLNIMHSRALSASISHMIDSSIIAYGLVLAKFKHNRSQVLYFVLFFILAAVSHGFYDFWLLNDVVREYSLITFAYLLTSILLYASFINNCLNNASDRTANIRLNTAKLSSDLAALLVGIFLFEYICLTLIYGPIIGNRELITSILGGGYLILFLAIRLSNIDIFPGEWYKIDWFVGFSPLQIIYSDKKPNYNLAIGKKILIQNFKPKSKLAPLLPAKGEIVSREKIRGSTAWFLVKLDPKISFYDYNNDYVVVRPKNMFQLLKKDEDYFYYFAAVENIEALKGPEKPDNAIVFIDWVSVREID